MPKRTSNSSVNSSIRQQTKSNEEGLGALLAAQQQTVEQLGSIRQLLELSKEKERQEKLEKERQEKLEKERQENLEKERQEKLEKERLEKEKQHKKKTEKKE